MAGQEGFEPPSIGFGVRRSTVRATGLHISPAFIIAGEYYLFCFFVSSMLFAEPAILAEFKLIRCGSLVFSRCIITTLTFGTRKCYYDSHG